MPDASSFSQLEASKVFASAIYADEHSNLPKGFILWTHFITTLEHMGKGYSEIFLVEEEDFDWCGIVSI